MNAFDSNSFLSTHVPGGNLCPEFFPIIEPHPFRDLSGAYQ
jgi:hypothetical protein